jgi:ribosomal protein L11 methyltransferase
VQHEIIITPKMSFGTGHHSTTLMMMQLMKNVDFTNKNILDFGTGTGILAILAEKLGADSVLAIDNDDWSITNARENLQANGCIKSTITKTSRLHNLPVTDVILANINLQVLLNEAENIAEISKEGTKLVLSGFLEKDIETLPTMYQKSGFKVIHAATEKGWAFLVLRMTGKIPNAS